MQTQSDKSLSGRPAVTVHLKVLYLGSYWRIIFQAYPCPLASSVRARFLWCGAHLWAQRERERGILIGPSQPSVHWPTCLACHCALRPCTRHDSAGETDRHLRDADTIHLSTPGGLDKKQSGTWNGRSVDLGVLKYDYAWPTCNQIFQIAFSK